jgi:C-terminal processing protease CtpA/Prc
MCLGAGFLILFTSGKMLKGANSYKTLDSGNFYEKLNAINSLLATEYIAPDQLSGAQSKMQENAIKAYVAGMDDPYTNYLTAEENTELLNALREETGISGI